MELILVVAKLISGILYETLRILFLVIDKLCDLVASVIKSKEKQEKDAREAIEKRHQKSEKKRQELEFEDMFPEAVEKEASEEKRKEIDLGF